MRPQDAVVCRTNLLEIGRILQLPECGSTHIGFHVENARHTAARYNIEQEIVERYNLGDLVHTSSLSKRVDFEDGFTCYGKRPISKQFVTMDFHPCLHKFHFR